MCWLNARQNVLSQNVANADTPGYTARDLKPVDFATCSKARTDAPRSAGLAVTDRAPHRARAQRVQSQSTDDADTRIRNAEPATRSRSKQEMIKVADTQAEYQAADQSLCQGRSA